MPRKTKHPGLRTHVRKGRDGQVWVYYYLDRRKEQLPDLPLGKDRDEALKLYDEYVNKRPRIIGAIEQAFRKFEEEELPKYENKTTRRNYAQSIKMLRPVFGAATWEGVRFAHLTGYLEARTAKRQANHELSVLSVVWNRARIWGMHEVPWPAAGMKHSKWKNKEQARQFEVTDRLFEAVYAEADQVLRDCMDLASATAMRLTDCINVPMPRGEDLPMKASKTGKKATFTPHEESVVRGVIERRKAIKADHLMLLSTKTGRRISLGMLRDRWDEARAKAATKSRESGDDDLAHEIEAMWLRDMRKYASDKAGSLDAAADLLQHSSKEVTRKHYQPAGTRLKTVR